MAAIMPQALRALDRVTDRIPLQPDRYGRGFFLLLSSVLGLTALSYWSLGTFWDVPWYAGEDGVTEWATVAMLLASVVFSAVMARTLARLGHRGLGLLFLAVAAGALLGTLEEISWGQRVFGWSTPESVASVNGQDETNLHNLVIVDRVVYTAILWGSLLALVGSVVRALLHRHGRVTTADFLLPSLALSPALLMIAMWTAKGGPVATLRTQLWSRPIGSEFSDLLFAIFLFLFTFANLQRAWALKRSGSPAQNVP